MGAETESHIYLIADSYVTYASLPTKTVGETTYAYIQVYTNSNDTNYNIYKTKFNSNGSDGIFLYYPYETVNGVAKVPKLRINSQYATEIQIKNLNWSYWIDNEKTGANKLNMKAVSSMLDTDLWKTYMDTSGKAQYAIGGPTIEMLLKSYNDTHGTDFGAKTTSDNGYKITKTATSNTGWTNSIASMLKTSSTEASNMPTSIKTLYVSETGQTNSNAYWLSSPADSDSNSLMDMDCSGGIFNPYYSINYIGFRPIVCLKSNVQLVEASGAKKDQGIDFELR